MTKFLTTRSLLALTGLLLMVGILSFSAETEDFTDAGASECLVSEENGEENELFWESLSRQFSGAVSNY